MENSFETKSISELCEITSSKRIYVADYRSGGVPFYRGKEIIEKQQGHLKISTELYISEEKYNKIKCKFGVPEPSDLLLTSVGTLGVPYVVKQNDKFYFKDGNITWFHKLNGLESYYLYYWFLSPAGKAELRKCVIGSSQPAFTIVLLKNMKIEIPSIPIQRKIVAILSAYDDLIENNIRRIQILEEMAQRIYQEWFVSFRFPGHKKVKFVDSELGKIPEGWEVSSLENIAELVKNKFFEDKHKKLPLLDLARIPRRSLVLNEFGKNDEIKTSRIVFKEDEILFGAIRPYFHKVIIAPCDGVTNTSVFVIRNKDVTGKYFLFSLLFSDETVAWATQYASGTKMPVISWEVFKKMKVIIPQKEIIEKFELTVEKIFALTKTLNLQNIILRTSRDLLLPKLISGELDVSDLDVTVENGT